LHRSAKVSARRSCGGAKSGLDVSARDLAYLYAAYASDKKDGTSEASNFKDAMRQHHRIDEVYRTSEDFFE